MAKLKLKSYWRTSKDNQPTDSNDVCESNLDSLIDIQAQHRQAWMTLRQQHPEASKTTLRRFAPAVYTWLYTPDKDWLNQNSPALQKPVPSVAKVDWAERDRQVLDKVKDAVRSLQGEDKPARITISRVGKTIGKLALVEKHLDQMSLTKAYLESVTETVEDFQIRRIKWAIKQLDDCGEEILRWKVVRVAQLREDCSERVKAALSTEIYRKSN